MEVERREMGESGSAWGRWPLDSIWKDEWCCLAERERERETTILAETRAWLQAWRQEGARCAQKHGHSVRECGQQQEGKGGNWAGDAYGVCPISQPKRHPSFLPSARPRSEPVTRSRRLRFLDSTSVLSSPPPLPLPRFGPHHFLPGLVQ